MRLSTSLFLGHLYTQFALGHFLNLMGIYSGVEKNEHFMSINEH